MSEATNEKAIVPSGTKNEQRRSLLSKPIERAIGGWHDSRGRKRERVRILSENEKALERMSEIGGRLRSLLDGDEFKLRQKESVSGPFEGGQKIVQYHLSLPAGEGDYSYSLDVSRKGDMKDGQAWRVGVYKRPNKIGDYTTGIGDGYWSITFIDDHKREKGKGRAMIISDSEVHGDLYLGPEMRPVVDRLKVSDFETSLVLKGVDFGGHPSLHVAINAWGQDPKTGRRVGPIGPIKELTVFGLARAAKPVARHIMDASDTIRVPVGDDSFQGQGLNFSFDRGEIQFGVKRRNEGGREVLGIGFQGQRQRLQGATYGGRPIEAEGGIERKGLTVPIDLVAGNKVIDILDRCVGELETSFEKRPLLGDRKQLP